MPIEILILGFFRNDFPIFNRYRNFILEGVIVLFLQKAAAVRVEVGASLGSIFLSLGEGILNFLEKHKGSVGNCRDSGSLFCKSIEDRSSRPKK
jgi:hypothetical protein